MQGSVPGEELHDWTKDLYGIGKTYVVSYIAPDENKPDYKNTVEWRSFQEFLPKFNKYLSSLGECQIILPPLGVILPSASVVQFIKFKDTIEIELLVQMPYTAISFPIGSDDNSRRHRINNGHPLAFLIDISDNKSPYPVKPITVASTNDKFGFYIENNNHFTDEDLRQTPFFTKLVKSLRLAEDAPAIIESIFNKPHILPK